MFRSLLLAIPVAVGCGSLAEPGDDDDDPTPVADITCGGIPDAGPARGFRHTGSDLIALAAPHHRGIDLVTTTEAPTQTLTGKITYGPTDKDLQDEHVDVYACLDDAWQHVGSAVTNTDGKFALALAGDRRLPAGLRDLYVSVAGDRTGAAFLALVAPAGSRLAVSDMDGTLTGGENAYPESLATGSIVPVQPGAPAALAAIFARDIGIVYLTARGDRFTQDSRAWLAANGFPRGPLKMPSAIITLPGEETVELKTALLTSLADFVLAAGIGNRASDVRAYTAVGLLPSRIFINLPEFVDELADDIAGSTATFVEHYDDLRTQHVPSL